MKKLALCVGLMGVTNFAPASEPASIMGGVLYDNGPIMTSSGTGIGGHDESVLENNTLGMISFGTAHHSSANLRVADDFVIADNDWQINSIDFFAYQTNETASSITNINLRIWDGVPTAPSSQIVFGDTVTNQLGSTTSANIYRVDEDTQGVATDREVAISNVPINITLTPGTYWLDWQTDGGGAGGTFVPHITISGQDTTGNALISIDNGSSYANLQDLGTLTNQGLPFIINGSVVAGQGIISVPGLRLPALIFLTLILMIPASRRITKAA